MLKNNLDINDIHGLDYNVMTDHLNYFLGNDSINCGYHTLLSRQDYNPDSFTLYDKKNNQGYISKESENFDSFIQKQIFDELFLIQQNNNYSIRNFDTMVSFLTSQFLKLANYNYNGDVLCKSIFYPEFPDVLRKLITFCLTDDLDINLVTHKNFNDLSFKVVTYLIENKLFKKNIDELFKYSITSGLIGLDVKGTRASASSFVNMGIPMANVTNDNLEQSANCIFDSLTEIASKGFLIDYFKEFNKEIIGSNNFRLVWCTDDYIETIFDLFLIQKLLEENETLTITIIPKNGQHGNDASYNDIQLIIQTPIFNKLNQFILDNRAKVIRNGPSMGLLNIKKLSEAAVGELEKSDAIYIKGCRSYEMTQGGMNRITYNSFIIVREFTESETGLDARNTPIVLLRNEPGEYSYWGFKGRSTCEKLLPDGRVIATCYSTLIDHENRKKSKKRTYLLSELEKLEFLIKELSKEYVYPCNCEIQLIKKRICDNKN